MDRAPRPRRHLVRWMIGGAVVALGAPLGLMLLWSLMAGDDAATWRSWTLTYVTVGTVVVFSLFGAAAGRLLDALEESRQLLAQDAREDPLTGLLNRRALAQELRTEWRRHERTGAPLTAILLDIDHFKRVNDEHGHAAGDAVLRTVAHATRACCREIDLVARYGGEEFVVVAPGGRLADASQLAERIRSVVEAAATRVDGKDLKVRISAGVASTEEPGCATPESLLGRADARLYRAKGTGRNRVVDTDAI